jgi:hypothetical protein
VRARNVSNSIIFIYVTLEFCEKLDNYFLAHLKHRRENIANIFFLSYSSIFLSNPYYILYSYRFHQCLYFTFTFRFTFDRNISFIFAQ